MKELNEIVIIASVVFTFGVTLLTACYGFWMFIRKTVKRIKRVIRYNKVRRKSKEPKTEQIKAVVYSEEKIGVTKFKKDIVFQEPIGKVKAGTLCAYKYNRISNEYELVFFHCNNSIKPITADFFAKYCESIYE